MTASRGRQPGSRSGDRPARAVVPGPGQVSVWDFPRPPRIERVDAAVRVEFAGRVIAGSRTALRVCETASPPVYYIPPSDVDLDLLEPAVLTSICEWKGLARYWHVRVGQRRATEAAWSYPEPAMGYEDIRDHVAFYAARVDACWVGTCRVEAQAGGFYGGWITPELVGPFKGDPGTEGW